MAKINEVSNRFHWAYKIGFLIILALPVLIMPPYFFPADWGKTIIFRSITAIILFLSIFQFFFKKDELKIPSLKKNAVFWILASLFAIYLLATIFSVDPYFSLWGNPTRSGGFVTFAFYFVFAVLAYIFFKKEDWQKAWFFSIIIGVFVSLLGVVQYYGLFNKIFLAVPDRPPSTMGNPIALATYLVILAFITLSFAIRENVRWKKIFYFFSLALFIYVILITGSRGAYLGLAVGALYYFLFYPKKIKFLKSAIVGVLILAAVFVFYVNAVNQYPKILQQNRLFISMSERLSINLSLTDPRFYAWTGVDYKILAERPILGYGPENFSVGFDRYYNPSIPYLSEVWGSWWDRAHNILLQTVADAGFLALIIYLALFVVLIWKLQKSKGDRTSEQYAQSALIPHTIQATLIGYLVTIFFSFDSFSTYILFFLLIAYSMHIIYGNLPKESKAKIQKNEFLKSACICFLFLILIIFLWQYNFVPLQINAEINNASDLVNQKQCAGALSLMDSVLPQQSFLDVYVRMQYITYEQTCSAYFPENILDYTKKGIEILSEAVKIQPLNTRNWLYMGTLTTALAGQTNDPKTADSLIKQANYDLDRATELAPKHQEILVGRAQLDIVSGKYSDAQNDSKKCMSLDPSLGDCYWYLAVSEIYLKDTADANKNIQLAISKGYDTNSEAKLVELVNAYGQIFDYQDLAPIFEKLTAINPNNIQYHSTLAFIYEKLGQEDKARQEAAKALQLTPNSTQSVDDFLKNLIP